MVKWYYYVISMKCGYVNLVSVDIVVPLEIYKKPFPAGAGDFSYVAKH